MTYDNINEDMTALKLLLDADKRVNQNSIDAEN
jgi:hypothetical protein